MNPLERKLRNLEQIADLQEHLGERLIEYLTHWIKKLCHTAKRWDEVVDPLPPALRSGYWAAPLLGSV